VKYVFSTAESDEENSKYRRCVNPKNELPQDQVIIKNISVI
jgi:hypothetical protein